MANPVDCILLQGFKHGRGRGEQEIRKSSKNEAQHATQNQSIKGDFPRWGGGPPGRQELAGAGGGASGSWGDLS